ncbi:MAG: EFR1 family ferrodoxin [Deltaproteobacteria bacterium]|nr:EFR1 family ferrodoxin [Deltaproteobacteria bacterium]
MKVLICYFSATGNTGQIAKAIGGRLGQMGAQVDYKDVTPLEARQEPVGVEPYDAVIIGSPIHSMRSPRLYREWLGTLEGQGKRAAMFFTYGGFQVHPAPYDLRRRLEERGFKVVASATFPGAHTYNLAGWQAMGGRPDQQDLGLAAEYAKELYPRLNGQDPAMVGDLNSGPYTEEQLDEFESFRFKMAAMLPNRQGEECQMCLLCQEQCPSGAMDAEKGEADPSKCIVCLQCVKDCPDQALKVGDMTPFFQVKMEKDQETAESLRKKRGKLYL